MVTAALDSGDVPTAHEHLQVLTRKFPGSQRVRRLEGMRCEAEGSFAAAAAIYEEMVEANPANSLARKRQVGVVPEGGGGGFCWEGSGGGYSVATERGRGVFFLFVFGRGYSVAEEGGGRGWRWWWCVLLLLSFGSIEIAALCSGHTSPFAQGGPIVLPLVDVGPTMSPGQRR